ncbi:MAG: single-stranded DNA-binding protein [Thiohalocapsa sp.]
MSMQAPVHGRIGQDPRQIQTKTGNPMTTASVAVDVSDRDQEATLWIKVIAFGRLADLLERHAKGEPLNAAGQLTLSKWTAEDGSERRPASTPRETSTTT